MKMQDVPKMSLIVTVDCRPRGDFCSGNSLCPSVAHLGNWGGGHVFNDRK
jgi:hypothetical protein